MVNINKNMRQREKKNECCVCLEEMTDDIYAGSCGHCFHQKCIDNLVGNKSPVCRTKTSFQKLHSN